MLAIQTQYPVQLSSKPQLAEARKGEDDWTGVADSATRRKIQTRLNTRAYRRRKALTSSSKTNRDNSKSTNDDSIPCWDEDQQAILILPASAARAMNFNSEPVFPDHPKDPTKKLIFPLSADHLIILIQLNVLRAVMINSKMVASAIPGASHGSHDCAGSHLRVFPPVLSSGQLPPNLKPTRAQSIVPHEGWVDSIPHPVWRDNFIRALGTFDEDDLCSDLLGRLFEGGTAAQCERTGIVVWSPPWHFSGWELSEGFMRKWGWSVKGCYDLLEITNGWRARRGEEPLVAEL